jgi:hypothetical protein
MDARDSPRVNSAEPPVTPPRLPRYDATPEPERKRGWMHPGSGVLILAVDWLFFAEEALTLGVALPVTCVLAFTITTAGVFIIQKRKSRDSARAALLKALVGGFLAGLPTSICGTVLGGWVLAMSGLAKRREQRR